MAKFKSIHIILIISLLFCFFLPNCSDESSDDEETLVGTWILTKLIYDFGLGVTLEIDPAQQDLSMRLTVREDKTFTMVITEGGFTTTSHGEWATSGNKLFITEEGETEEFEYSLKGDKLQVSFEETEDGTTYTLTQEFTRQ